MMKWSGVSILAGAAVAFAVGSATVSGAVAKQPFDQLVAAAKAEMDKKQGVVRFALDWPDADTKAVIPAFMKAFPFVKKMDYVRENGIGPFGRYLLEIQQGGSPPYDFMHVAEEYETQYLSAGAFIKPPFDYNALNDSLPDDWPKINEAAKDPNGYYLSTSAVVRGIAWNTRLVPPGSEPTSWNDCIDPKWKGKVVLDSRNKLQAFQYDPKLREAHLAWLKGLVANKATFIDGQAAVLQKVAAGEYPIACAINYQTAQRMIDAGVHVLKFGLADPIPLEMGTRIYVGKWSTEPATTQLFTLWLATAGQGILDQSAYRGYPGSPNTRTYAQAQGKYVAVCPPECLARLEEYEREWASILGIASAD